MAAEPNGSRYHRANPVNAMLVGKVHVVNQDLYIDSTQATPVQDFRAHLLEQLSFLDASAERYDAGQESEAKRMAATIRLLVHDGRPPTRSLLSHLGVRDRLPWTDTAAGEIQEAALTIGSGLAMTRMETGEPGTSRFAPFLGDLPPERIHPGAAFVDWWNATVLTDADGSTYSRRSLVLGVADKDGGAHVDRELPDAYVALTRENSIGITQVPSVEPNSVGIGFGVTMTEEGPKRARIEGAPLASSPVLANIRQIGWELRDTVRRHLVLDSPKPYVRAAICSLSIDAPIERRADGLCPCGSGRPYERCRGARQPRRTFSLADLAD